MAAPVVAVVIPAYNAARYIASTVDSVLSQTLTGWQMIIVDDGSTDDTARVLQSIPPDPRIRIHFQHNQGAAAARNVGLARCDAPLVCFLDADDIWLPDFLKQLVAAIQSCPESPLACAGWSYIDAEGRALPQAPMKFPRDMRQLQQELLWRNAILPSAALLRTQAVRACGGFDETFGACEDWDLWLRLREAGPFVSVPEVLTQYRVYGTSRSDQFEEIEQAQLQLNRKYLGPAEGPPSAWPLPRRRAMGHTYFVSALQYLRSRRPYTGLSKLRQAVHIWPELVDETEFHFELACAFQGRGYRGTAVGMRLRRSASLARLILREIQRMGQWPLVCLTFSQVAWSAGLRRASALFALQGLCWPSVIGKFGAMRALVRTIVPQWLLGRLRHSEVRAG